MKTLLTLTLALIALVVFGNPSLGQGVQQKDKQKTPPAGVETKQPKTAEVKIDKASPTAQVAAVQGADTKKLVAEAIASSIVKTPKGVEFPLVAKGTGSETTLTGGASCELGDTQTFTQGAPIDLEGAKHQPASYSLPDPGPEVAIYSPQNADFLLQSFNRVITSAGPPYDAAVTSFPAGYSFLEAGNYSSVKSTMHSFVGSLNIPGYIKADLNAKLDTLISNISSYSYSVGANYGTVKHTATVHGTGVFNTQTAHAWYHAYINGTLICAPAYLHDQNALTTRLKTWVNSVVHKLPVTVTTDIN